MKRFGTALGGVALALILASVPAHANRVGPNPTIMPLDPAFDWTLSGPIPGSGTLNTDASGNITSFTGMIDGDAVSLLGGDPGMPVPSPSKLFGYDNILFASNSSALLDFYGILFTVNGGQGELFGDGMGNYGLLTEANGLFVLHDPSGEAFSVSSITTSGTPEPGTWVLLAIGLGLVGFMARGIGRRNISALA